MNHLIDSQPQLIQENPPHNSIPCLVKIIQGIILKIDVKLIESIVTNHYWIIIQYYLRFS